MIGKYGHVTWTTCEIHSRRCHTVTYIIVYSYWPHEMLLISSNICRDLLWMMVMNRYHEVLSIWSPCLTPTNDTWCEYGDWLHGNRAIACGNINSKAKITPPAKSGNDNARPLGPGVELRGCKRRIKASTYITIRGNSLQQLLIQHSSYRKGKNVEVHWRYKKNQKEVINGYFFWLLLLLLVLVYSFSAFIYISTSRCFLSPFI